MPREVRRVSVPTGVVDWLLAMEKVCVRDDGLPLELEVLVVLVEAREREENCDVGVDPVGVDGPEPESELELELELDWVDGERETADAVEGVVVTSEDMPRVTIFIPLLVEVLAGMKRVFWLFAAGIEMRCGWLVWQHPVDS